MRKKIYEIIELSEDNKISNIYNVFMIIAIVAGMVPLCTHTNNCMINILDIVTLIVFAFDYLLRLITADYRLNKGTLSFLIYPFTGMAVIDLLSILPGLTLISNLTKIPKSFKIFKIVRLLRTFRVFRAFKAFRYSKSISMIVNVFKRQKESLLVVCGFAAAYIIVSALVIFNVEPETFPTLYDAIYWATISLTTVGYGDIYATSNIGKAITMISAVLGVAIVALPAGIIIAGYQEELNKPSD